MVSILTRHRYMMNCNQRLYDDETRGSEHGSEEEDHTQEEGSGEDGEAQEEGRRSHGVRHHVRNISTKFVVGHVVEEGRITAVLPAGVEVEDCFVTE
jgi:hypothetical protein